MTRNQLSNHQNDGLTSFQAKFCLFVFLLEWGCCFGLKASFNSEIRCFFFYSIEVPLIDKRDCVV